jgi:hypothetical protein
VTTQFDTIFANRKLEPPAGSFEAAELFQLRMALKST